MIRIFDLGAPYDEVEEVRRLLTEHGVAYYETPRGTSGYLNFDDGAIWVNDAAQAREARALIDAYEQEREKKARQAYAELKAERKAERKTHPFIDNLIEKFRRYFIYIAVAVGALYFLIISTTHFGK